MKKPCPICGKLISFKGNLPYPHTPSSQRIVFPYGTSTMLDKQRKELMRECLIKINRGLTNDTQRKDTNVSGDEPPYTVLQVL